MSKVRQFCLTLCVLIAATRASALTVFQFNSAVTENFDSLAASATGSALPPGWGFFESGTSANTTYSAGAGTSATGDTYSFGAVGSTDRAFGTLLTGSLSAALVLNLTNGTSAAITQIGIAYVGEQWRLGSTGRADRLDFAYSLDGTNWVEVDALDFIAPNSSGPVGALDGNATGNRIEVIGALSGLNLAVGQSLWLRWADYGAAGSDDGLGIDNFSLTAIQPVAPPVGGSVPDSLPSLWIAGTFAAVISGASVRRRTGAPARAPANVT
jgi:hypothetical protein